jgi:hypothetical protein
MGDAELAAWLRQLGHTSAAVALRGCTALAQLTEPQARAAAGAAAAAEALTLVLRQHAAASADVASVTCAAMNNVLENNSATRAAALRAGAVEAVVATMNAHADDSHVQQNACIALYELGVCHSQLYRAACARAGAAHALLNVVRARAVSELAPRTAHCALRALMPLTAMLEEPGALAQLLNGDDCLLAGAVCDVMRRFTAYEPMQYFSAVVLHNLMEHPLVQQRACGDAGGMRGFGLVQLCVEALRTHPASVRIRVGACDAIARAALHVPAVARAAGAVGACEAVVSALQRCCGHGGACACGGGGRGPDKNDAYACRAACIALQHLASKQPENAARLIPAGAFPALLRLAHAHLHDHGMATGNLDEVLVHATHAMNVLIAAAPQHAPMAAAHAGASRIMAAAIATHGNEGTRLFKEACCVLTKLPTSALRSEAAAEAVPAAGAVAGAMTSQRCAGDPSVQWAGCNALYVLADDVRAAAERATGDDDAALTALVAASTAALGALRQHTLPPAVRCIAAAALGALAIGHDGMLAAAEIITAVLMRARGAREEGTILTCAVALAEVTARCAPATNAEMARSGVLRELEAVSRTAPRGSELAAAAARATGALRAAADAAAAAAAAELLAEEEAAHAAPAGKSRRKKRGGGGGGGGGSAPPAAATSASLDAADVDADAPAPAVPNAPAPAPVAAPSAADAAPVATKSRRRRTAASRAAAAAAAATTAGVADAVTAEQAGEGGASADAQQHSDATADAAEPMPEIADDVPAAAVQDALAALTVAPPPPLMQQQPMGEPAPNADDTSAAAAPDAPPAPPAPPAPDAPDAAPLARRTAPRAYEPPMGPAPPLDGAAPSFLPPPPPPPSSDSGGGASGVCGSSMMAAPLALPLAPPAAPAAAPPPPVTKECVVALMTWRKPSCGCCCRAGTAACASPAPMRCWHASRQARAPARCAWRA